MLRKLLTYVDESDIIKAYRSSIGNLFEIIIFKKMKKVVDKLMKMW